MHCTSVRAVQVLSLKEGRSKQVTVEVLTRTPNLTKPDYSLVEKMLSKTCFNKVLGILRKHFEVFEHLLLDTETGVMNNTNDGCIPFRPSRSRGLIFRILALKWKANINVSS